MEKKFDITGKWLFSEEFDYGRDSGFAEFKVVNEQIVGFLEYVELIDGEDPFKIKQWVEGYLDGSLFYMKGVSYEILHGEEGISYNLDSWEGAITMEGKIVGSSYDNEEIFGVFVLEREEA